MKFDMIVLVAVFVYGLNRKGEFFANAISGLIVMCMGIVFRNIIFIDIGAALASSSLLGNTLQRKAR